MTYNEWRDELKNNLLSVSDAERRRVLDYYAEAYADRREAGFTEREIIADFGAPYDAAQRILNENDDETYTESPKYTRYDDCRNERGACREERRARHEERRESSEVKTVQGRGDYTWVFVLLCIIFAVPLLGIIMSMVGVTISLCVAPFGMLVSGIGKLIAGVGLAFTNVSVGVARIGVGLIETGVGIVLFPLCFWLVKLMWKLFRKLFGWIKRLFSGKEVV